jgi:flavodoxin I
LIKMMHMKISFVAAALVATLDVSSAWTNQHVSLIRTAARSRASSSRLEAAVGIFFGTSTGSTQEAADFIYAALGSDIAAEPEDVETLEDVAAAFSAHDALIVGTPTWNTGAEVERSGTGWDELYYAKMPSMKEALKDKKVAVFGLGDQESYAENFADATGELFDVFESLGCKMLGAWSQEGYEHEDSKSIRGDKFCGLLLDVVNQEELTEERANKWVEQLKGEGILEGASAGATSSEPAAAPAPAVVTAAAPAPPAVVTAPAPPVVNVDRAAPAADKLKQVLEQVNWSKSTGGFTPHHNAKTGKTLWTSPDGRKAYVTSE